MGDRTQQVGRARVLRALAAMHKALEFVLQEVRGDVTDLRMVIQVAAMGGSAGGDSNNSQLCHSD